MVAVTSGARERARRYALGCIEVDTRTLALFRMLAGVLILVDLILRAQRFSEFYTDDGVVPRWLAMDLIPGALSVYHLSGGVAVTAALFVVQGAIALQLIAGYRTRIAAILSFILVVSLDHRNPLVTSYADTLFRLLLLWAVFLPLGERWSIDAVYRQRPPRPQVANVASAAILVQMVFMYLVNGYHKTTGELWATGEAAVLVFGIDEITYFLGDAMRSVPTLVQYGGLLWFGMMLASPLLLLLPGRARMLAAVLFIAGHAAFALTVRIGAFPYVAMAGVLLFAQARAWEDARSIARLLRLSAAREERVRRGLDRLVRGLAARLPRPAETAPAWRAAGASAARMLLAAAVVGVLAIPGLSTLAMATGVRDDLGPVERWAREAAVSLGVNQPDWTIFAPDPRRIDRWHVIAARTTDAVLLDVFNDRPLTFERPYRQLQRQHRTYRDRFYMDQFAMEGVTGVGRHGDAADVLARYYCRTWPRERGVELTHVSIYAVTEAVTRETIDAPEARDRETRLVRAHGCDGRAPEVIGEPDESA